MRSLALPFGVLAMLAAAPAQAQFTTAIGTAKPAPSYTHAPTGGFLGGGSDDCAAPQLIAGQGTFSFDLSAATTGAEGQNEALCYAFGTSGIDSDVWYDWFCDDTGMVTVQTCGGTAVDTKIAAYAGGGCPADGTALACNDDTCGLQSSIAFSGTNGAGYTIQVGTFPGGTPGSGTFDIGIVPDPPSCPDFSDGTAENSLGLVAGGDIAMLQYFDCLNEVKCVEAAFGAPGFPDPSLVGLPVTVAVYSDDDDDPTNGMTLLATTTSFISIQGQDQFLGFAIEPSVDFAGSGWVAVIVECTTAGQFPLAFDQDFPNPGAWVAGDTTCSLDPNDLTNSDVGVLNMAAIGFPSSWLMRASGTLCYPPSQPGTKLCWGVGCPCGNDDPFGGCQNSTGSGGRVFGDGTASVALDDMIIIADRLVPNQPATLFSGDEALNGGNGRSFGDGLRCVGVNVFRFSTQVPGADGMLQWGPGVIGIEGGQPGQTRLYQGWYRDPMGGPCASGFNLTNAYQVTFLP